MKRRISSVGRAAVL